MRSSGIEVIWRRCRLCLRLGERRRGPSPLCSVVWLFVKDVTVRGETVGLRVPGVPGPAFKSRSRAQGVSTSETGRGYVQTRCGLT
jgi:hypothetical protein